MNARDRIGRGPWFNAKGLQVAADLDELHRSNALGAKTSLDEFGESPGYWHDMMTGSNPDGTLANGDVTCGNWASTHGHVLVGHSDKGGRLGGNRATSWNSAHSSGCTMTALQSVGGNTLLLFRCGLIDDQAVWDQARAASLSAILKLFGQRRLHAAAGFWD